MTLRRRVSGQLVQATPLSIDQALEALGAAVGPDMAEKLRNLSPTNADRDPNQDPGYLRGYLTLSSSEGIQPQLIAMPIYPRGLDVVIRAKASTGMEFGTQRLGLPTTSRRR